MAGRAAEPEVIWARPERAGRGPKPAYSRADIAAAAVRVADADGLDAVSMRRVAAEIGCGTMSLYNYVPRKEDLYELMVDLVGGEYEFGEAPSGDWRGDMAGLARQTLALMRRHPWVTRVLTSGYAVGPNTLRYLEWCLGCLRTLDVPGGVKLELIGMVNGSVMTFVAGEQVVAERARAVPWSAEREAAVRGAYMAGRVGSGEYPNLAAVLGEGVAGAPVGDAAFEVVIGRLLDAYAPRG